MANFAEFCDDGFQGRIFPHQRAKLREYFCLNPWPDTEFVYRIAAEIGEIFIVVEKILFVDLVFKVFLCSLSSTISNLSEVTKNDSQKS